MARRATRALGSMRLAASGRFLLALALAIGFGLLLARAEEPAPGLTRAEAYARAAALEALGRTLFFEPSLSASGQMSCASCHDPAHGFGPPNALSVQLGADTAFKRCRRCLLGGRHSRGGDGVCA